MRMTVHSFDFVGVVKGFNGTPDQKLNALRDLVTAGEACVRLRSNREIRQRGPSGLPRAQVSRLLRSRTQASPAATGRGVLYQRTIAATQPNASNGRL
jgi:hypothetical protein